MYIHARTYVFIMFYTKVRDQGTSIHVGMTFLDSEWLRKNEFSEFSSYFNVKGGVKSDVERIGCKERVTDVEKCDPKLCS